MGKRWLLLSEENPMIFMNNEPTKQRLFSEISQFRALTSAADNASIVNGFDTIKTSIAGLSGNTQDEKNIFIEAQNVAQLFSKADYELFTKAGKADFPQKTAALARLQEWAKRAGDILQDT
ncbi:MAG: hypothetical protein JWP57_1143 [Spirosoma sp.]|nr:hypothetical protein [Spirosoma sp.]